MAYPGQDIDELYEKIAFLEKESATFAARLSQAELANESLERQWKTQCGVNQVTEKQLMIATEKLSDLGFIRSADGMSYAYDYESLKN